MAIPVINTTTSVIGYKQWQLFEYQPFATNNPYAWDCPNLPQGLSIDAPTAYAATGVAATDVITATGHTFANDDAVYFLTLTGGSGLSAHVIYYVRDKTTNTLKLAATKGGTAIDFSSDISAASISKISAGKISGAAEVAGVFVVGLTATNADGTSTALALTIGIEPANAALTSSGYEVEIDVVTRKLTLISDGAANGGGQASGSAADSAKVFAKEDDSLLLWIRFKKGDQVLDLDIQTLAIAVKEFEPDTNRLVLGNEFVKRGVGTAAYYGLYASISGAALAAALTNYEEDQGTRFDALAEIEWQETNADFGDFGPAQYRFTTQDFALRIGRDMAQEA